MKQIACLVLLALLGWVSQADAFVAGYPGRMGPPAGGLQPSYDVSLYQALPSNITFTRASDGTYYASSGLLTTAGSNQARFGHLPTTLQPRGLYMEGASVNLVERSEEFDHSFWIGGGSATITSNTTVAPTGLQTADTYTEGGGTSILRNNSAISISSSAIYTGTTMLKRGNADWATLNVTDSAGRTNGQQVWFNLATGSVGQDMARGSGWSLIGKSIQSLGNGWYRCSVTVSTSGTSLYLGVTSAASDGSTSRADVGGGAGVGVTMQVFGAQVERSPFSTSYIATTSSAATRALDSAVASSTSVGFNASEGTLVAGFEMQGISNTQVIAQFDDGTNSNAIRLAVVSGTLRAQTIVSGSESANLSLGSATSNTTYRAAFSFKAGDFAASVNGSTAVTSATGALPSGITNLRLGSGVSANHLSGWLRTLQVYPSAIGSSVQAVTQ